MYYLDNIVKCLSLARSLTYSYYSIIIIIIIIIIITI